MSPLSSMNDDVGKKINFILHLTMKNHVRPLVVIKGTAGLETADSHS